jgi:predicted MFS family arabinose efflux permease
MSQEFFSYKKLFSVHYGYATLSGMNPVTLTALAYIPAVLSMMTIGIIVPFIDTLEAVLATNRAQIGLAIALFSVPAAILATMGGALIDRYGVRRCMLIAAAVAALGSSLASQAHSVPTLDAGMLVAGFGFGTMCVASPCLIMLTLTGGARIRAMSFASTFAPTGYAAGLLLAVPFTGSGNWRAALLAHAGLFAVCFVALLLFVPRIQSNVGGTRDSLRQSFGRMLGIFREPRAIRLGIAVALPNAVSYGTSLAAPSYLARVHHLSIATSSASVAIAKLAAMLIGGLSMGYLLSRAVRPALLFTVMAAVGVLAQIVLFLPDSSMPLATMGLVLWLFSFGGMAGGAMTLLPSVAGDPSRSGSASGLVNQFISLASFAAPSTWLALQNGVHYVLLAMVCLLISCIALPAPRAATLVPQ